MAPQQAYSFGLSQLKMPDEQFTSNIDFGQDKSHSLQYQAFPLGKNKIMVRFENLADKFDIDTAFSIKYFDVKKFTTQFYQQANNGVLPRWTTIDEVNLSGNILISELKKLNTYEWKGDDDGAMLNQPVNKGPKDHGDEKALEPQRIRTFVISYNQRREFLDIAQQRPRKSLPL